MNNKNEILSAVKAAVNACYTDSDTENLITETPKNTALGDVAVPMFSLAKSLRQSPAAIAKAVTTQLKEQFPSLTVNADGAYINIFYDKQARSATILQQVLAQKAHYGLNTTLQNQKIMVEFSGPNTNKPLHLGHMRNNCLGESVSRLLKKSGADVCKVNIVNDRGVHICKSMLAYKMFGEGKTPESEGIKSDRFVGDYYVKYASWAKDNPQAEEEAQKLLTLWEQGDKETLALWRLMNDWAVNGINETYRKTGISFDKVYYESNTYKLGKNIVEEGLSKGVFFRADDGSIRLDLSELDGKDEQNSKVFLRSDGTSVYVTQDLGTAISRHEDFPFNRMIYVVAHEQQRHFQVLFYALKKLGYSWAEMLYHLSYGMVNLPEGKMKSREGTVVDADDLISSLTAMAQEEINSKDRQNQVESDTAFKIALGALHYFLLQVNPTKDMIFDPKESLSFNGNTGPYLQYTAARITSMLSKEQSLKLLQQPWDSQWLNLDDEWQLLRLLDDFPQVIAKAAGEYAPSHVANYLYDLAKSFNKYYHDTPVLADENERRAVSRLHLIQAVLTVFKNGFDALNIPYLAQM